MDSGWIGDNISLISKGKAACFSPYSKKWKVQHLYWKVFIAFYRGFKKADIIPPNPQRHVKDLQWRGATIYPRGKSMASEEGQKSLGGSNFLGFFKISLFQSNRESGSGLQIHFQLVVYKGSSRRYRHHCKLQTFLCILLRVSLGPCNGLASVHLPPSAESLLLALQLGSASSSTRKNSF